MAENMQLTPYFDANDPLRQEVVGTPLVRFAERAHAILGNEPWHKSGREYLQLDGLEERLPMRERRAVRIHDGHWEYGTDASDLSAPRIENARIYGSLSLRMVESEFFRRRMLGLRREAVFSCLGVQLDFPQETYRSGNDGYTSTRLRPGLQPYKKPVGDFEICYRNGMVCAINENKLDLFELARRTGDYAALASRISFLDQYVEIASPWKVKDGVL